MGKIYLKTRSQSKLISSRIEALNAQIEKKTEAKTGLIDSLLKKNEILAKMEVDINSMIEKWKTLPEDKKKGRSENPILRIWRSEMKIVENKIKAAKICILKLEEEIQKVENRLLYYMEFKPQESIRGYQQKKRPSIKPEGRLYSKAQRKAIARKKLEEELGENGTKKAKPFKSHLTSTPNVQPFQKKKAIIADFMKKVRKQRSTKKVLTF